MQVKHIQYQVHLSIQDIPRHQWDSVWPRAAEGYNFYLSQEKSGIEGFHFLYVVISADDAVILIAPLFVATFNLGLALSDRGRSLLQRIQRLWPGFLMVRTLFCGSPVTERGIIGVHPSYHNDADVIKIFDRALLELAREHAAGMIVLKDFIDSDLAAFTSLGSLGYFKGDSLPMALLPIRFASVDEYLSTLTYGTRKDLRRKIRKTRRSSGIEIEVAHDIHDHIDEVYQLYLNVYNTSSMHFEKLTKEFFLNFARFMPDETIFFLYWTVDDMRTGAADGGRRLIGFNFCLHRQDDLIDKYLGMDYSVSRDLNLYFISFLHNVTWCLENGKKTYRLSQGGYPVKLKLGAELMPMRTMTKIMNPVINWFANRVSRIVLPKAVSR